MFKNDFGLENFRNFFPSYLLSWVLRPNTVAGELGVFWLLNNFDTAKRLDPLEKVTLLENYYIFGVLFFPAKFFRTYMF